MAPGKHLPVSGSDLMGRESPLKLVLVWMTLVLQLAPLKVLAIRQLTSLPFRLQFTDPLVSPVSLSLPDFLDTAAAAASEGGDQDAAAAAAADAVGHGLPPVVPYGVTIVILFTLTSLVQLLCFVWISRLQRSQSWLVALGIVVNACVAVALAWEVAAFHFWALSGLGNGLLAFASSLWFLGDIGGRSRRRLLMAWLLASPVCSTTHSTFHTSHLTPHPQFNNPDPSLFSLRLGVWCSWGPRCGSWD